jgi:hypothetical protein
MKTTEHVIRKEATPNQRREEKRRARARANMDRGNKQVWRL